MKYYMDDFKIERQDDVKVCGMTAKVNKITNKKTNNVRYSCMLPLTTHEECKKNAIKEIEFLMTMVQRLRQNDK